MSKNGSSCSFFSIGSATWSRISAAVAPGHCAETMATLIVKSGSSARPRRMNDIAPAAASIRMKKSISVGWPTAKRERLKPRIAQPSTAVARTGAPACSRCAPSTTTRSPPASPETIRADPAP